MNIWILVTNANANAPGYDIIDIFADETLAKEHLAAYKHNTGDDLAILIEYEVNTNKSQRI